MNNTNTAEKDRVRGADNGAVPREIVHTLQALARRMRWVALIKGTAAVVAVALASLLLVLAADWLVTTSSPVYRWSLSLLQAGVVAISIAWFVVRPLGRRLDLAAVARQVEMRHPELHERISSAFELMRLTTGDRASRGSEQLIGALVHDAVSDVGQIRPRREIRLERAKRSALLAAIPLLMLAVLFICWRRETMTLLTRLVTPYRDQANAHALDLLVEPPGATIPIGDPLTISVRSSTGPLEEAQLLCIDAVGRETLLAMQQDPTRDGQNAYSVHWDSVPANFRFRIRAGRALTGFYEITCVPRPTIESIEAKLIYPQYTNRAEVSIRNPSQPIEGPVGSEVDLTVTTNSAQLEGTLRLAELVVPPSSLASQRDRGTFHWRLKLDFAGSKTATLVFRDADQRSSRPASVVFKTVPDAPPSVTIVEPARPKVTLPPNDHLAILFDARDDFGIGLTELVMTVDGAAAVPVPPAAVRTVMPKTPRVEPGGFAWRGAMILDLGVAVPATARAVGVRVRVADTRAATLGGSQTAESRPLEIIIRRGGDDYATQKIAEQSGNFQRDLAVIIALLRGAKADAVSLNAALAAPGKPWKSVAKELQSKLDEAGRQLAAVADDWQETLMARFAPVLRAVGDEEVRPAHNLARSIELAEDPPQQVGYAVRSDAHIAKAIQRLTALLALVEEQKSLLEKLAQLENLALREQRLAELAELEKEKSDDAEKPSSEWRDQQQQLAKEIAQAAQQAQQDQKTPESPEQPEDMKPADMKPEDMKPEDEPKPDDKTKPTDESKPMEPGDMEMMNPPPQPSPMDSPSLEPPEPDSNMDPQQPTPPMQGTPPPTDSMPAEESEEEHGELVAGPGSGLKGEAVGGMGLQKSDGPKPESGFGSTPLDLQGPGAAAFGKGTQAQPGTQGVGAVGAPTPGAPPGTVASALTDASDSANSAGSSSSVGGAESAARKSADSLATAAQAVAKAAKVPSVAGALAKAAPQGPATAAPDASHGSPPLAEKGNRPWALFHGRTQAGQAGVDLESIPVDYRDLTGNYFRAMSKHGAGQGTNDGKQK